MQRNGILNLTIGGVRASPLSSASTPTHRRHAAASVTHGDGDMPGDKGRRVRVHLGLVDAVAAQG
jgi:hypothetical protein